MGGGACNGSPAPVASRPPAPRPDVHVAHLTDLLTAVGLEWLVLASPRELLGIEWLRPGLRRLLRSERLDLLARTTGIDLREVPELALAGYRAGEGEDVVAYFLRHRASPIDVERKFRERLTSEAARSLEGHQLVGSWGKIGLADRAFAAIGPAVVGFQFGGSRRRGPARIALLYARGELESVPTVHEDAILRPLRKALEPAPLMALVPGPFEGELARGARGLLAAAEAFGASLAPSSEQALRLQLVLRGALPADARAYLDGAWSDLAKSDLGHLLGLHAPRGAPTVAAERDGLRLTALLDPQALLSGLSAATIDDVREIMR